MDEVVLTSHESAAEESGDPGNKRSSIGPVISIDQEPARPYPDTVESGETYDLEAHVDLIASGQSEIPGRTRSMDWATITRRLL
ncbi:hypothetical protein AUI07_00440 [archaeon 13_2_20CM_2_53_6]|nr:MAG: hypothetical protein AUI07_00440 [archaeon 13_2_20CM_2_53_6]